MKNLRIRLAVVGSALVILTVAGGLIRERENSHLTQFRFEQAISLYASENPMERHLALQLLRDLPEPHQAIPLIGRRLEDADQRNRLYAIHCLEEMLGPVVSLPYGAERDASGMTRMSNEASAEYIRRWQAWFSAQYPNA
jgi:hypothetical protein